MAGLHCSVVCYTFFFARKMKLKMKFIETDLHDTLLAVNKNLNFLKYNVFSIIVFSKLFSIRSL